MKTFFVTQTDHFSRGVNQMQPGTLLEALDECKNQYDNSLVVRLTVEGLNDLVTELAVRHVRVSGVFVGDDKWKEVDEFDFECFSGQIYNFVEPVIYFARKGESLGLTSRIRS